METQEGDGDNSARTKGSEQGGSGKACKTDDRLPISLTNFKGKRMQCPKEAQKAVKLGGRQKISTTTGNKERKKN